MSNVEHVRQKRLIALGVIPQPHSEQDSEQTTGAGVKRGVIDLTSDDDGIEVNSPPPRVKQFRQSDIRIKLDAEELPSNTLPSHVLGKPAHWLWMIDGRDSTPSYTGQQELDLQTAWMLHISSWESTAKTPKTNSKPSIHDVANLAIQHNILVGKWMVKAKSPQRIDEIWAHVQSMLLETTCSRAKLSVQPENELHTFIIYVNDFTDKKKVDNCLHALREIVPNPAWLYFKGDATTILGINSNNPWKLKVSFYRHKKDASESETLFDTQKGTVGVRKGGSTWAVR